MFHKLDEFDGPIFEEVLLGFYGIYIYIYICIYIYIKYMYIYIYIDRVAHKNVPIFLWRFFTKIREPSRFFLHRYWKFIQFFWWNLKSIIFYDTFSVINTMFVPCTTLLYGSTEATRTLKLFTTLLIISCGIRLISLLIMSSLVFGLFSQTFRYPFRR